MLAIALAVTSLVLVHCDFNGVTALVIWLTAFVSILSAIFLSIKLTIRLIYFDHH